MASKIFKKALFFILDFIEVGFGVCLPLFILYLIVTFETWLVFFICILVFFCVVYFFGWIVRRIWPEFKNY